MKNIIAKFFLLVAIVMLSGCIYGGRYVVKTVTTETINRDGTVIKNTTQEEVPIAEPVVVYPETGTVYSYPIYGYGVGYNYGYGYGYYGYDHKVKETYKEKNEGTHWDYTSPNGNFSAGGYKDSSKSTNKWHRK